ncbi:MAG: hypothetical protein WKG07_17825 [Hymenobacter sp.]
MLAEQGPARRYLVEALEPQATDSFFAWGFFDSVLQQKEHYSDYVFEDLAAEFLTQNPAVRQQLEAAKRPTQRWPPAARPSSNGCTSIRPTPRRATAATR